MSSKRPSEESFFDPVPPATAADVRALRAAAEAAASSGPLDDWRRLEPPELFGPIPPRTTTSAGWEPFTLDPAR